MYRKAQYGVKAKLKNMYEKCIILKVRWPCAIYYVNGLLHLSDIINNNEGIFSRRNIHIFPSLFLIPKTSVLSMQNNVASKTPKPIHDHK